MDEIRKNIKRIRNEKGWSQKQLADKLFVNHSAVSKWENGTRKIDTENAAKIASALEVSIEVLYRGVVIEEKIKRNYSVIEYGSYNRKYQVFKFIIIILGCSFALIPLFEIPVMITTYLVTYFIMIVIDLIAILKPKLENKALTVSESTSVFFIYEEVKNNKTYKFENILYIFQNLVLAFSVIMIYTIAYIKIYSFGEDEYLKFVFPLFLFIIFVLVLVNIVLDTFFNKYPRDEVSYKKFDNKVNLVIKRAIIWMMEIAMFYVLLAIRFYMLDMSSGILVLLALYPPFITILSNIIYYNKLSELDKFKFKVK